MKFLQIKPQKARGALRESMWSDLEWVAEEKYDGDRRIAQFLPGKIRFTGTRESVDGTGFVEKSDCVPHLSKFPTRGHPLEGTVLDGEICTSHVGRGGKSKYVTAIMGSAPEVAIEKQKANGWLEYVVFDCLKFCGKDIQGLPLRERQNFRDQALKVWSNKSARKALQHVGPDKKKFYEEIVARGGEGVILKHRDHRYGDSKKWVKVKYEETADVIICGFTEGRGKYAGQIGAVQMGQWRAESGKVQALVEVGTCSGFDDGLRASFSASKAVYMSRVIEITHNGREPTGAFRHPRFKRFRDDKNPRDCIFNLEEK